VAGCQVCLRYRYSDIPSHLVAVRSSRVSYPMGYPKLYQSKCADLLLGLRSKIQCVPSKARLRT
jgi:hypothetical protein